MRALLAATALVPDLPNGGRTYLTSLLQTLHSLVDVQVGVVVAPQEVQRLPAVEAELLLLPLRKGAMRVPRDWFKIGELARSWHADVVIYPHEWSPPTGVPTIQVVQNVGWMHPRSTHIYGARGKLLHQLARRTERAPAGRVFVSEFAAQLWKVAGFAPAAHERVIPEGIDVPGLRSPGRRYDVVAVTGPDEYKMPELTLASLAEIRRRDPKVECLVVGQPAQLSRPGISCTRWLERPELLSHMRAATVTLFLSAVESFGLPAFESCAVGTPCVVLEQTPMAHANPYMQAVEESAASVADVAEALLHGLVEVSGPRPRTSASLGAEWAELLHVVTG